MANFQALAFKIHAHKRWKKFPDFSFAAADTVCPLVIQELPKAMLKLPIAFIPIDDKFCLCAVQGLEPEKNLLVSTDGKWRSRYVPEGYRCYPFVLAKGPEGQQVLCINEDSELIFDEENTKDSNDGERFFEENGEPSQIVNKVLAFLSRNAASRAATTRICDSLQEHELIEPWPIRFKIGDKELEVTGLFRINETALNQVSADTLLILRDNGALTAAYCQLLSMTHLDQLVKLAQTQIKNPSSELNFDAFDQGGSLNFDNI